MLNVLYNVLNQYSVLIYSDVASIEWTNPFCNTMVMDESVATRVSRYLSIDNFVTPTNLGTLIGEIICVLNTLT